MKNAICILLALVLTASLAACSGNSTAESTSPSFENTQVQQTETVTEPGYEEIVLADNDDCAFTISGFDEENLWGYTLKAYLQNKTEKNLIFTLEAVSVNGFMCDPFWAAEVAPGKISNEEISFLSGDFEENGITDVTDISFTLKVYDAEDFNADPVFRDSFTIYPQGEEAVRESERTSVEGEIVLFDNEQFTMIITGVDEDNAWGYGLNIYLENKTAAPLLFSTENVSVNDIMCDPFWATEVAPGKRMNTTISWFEEAFTENEITTVEEIELTAVVWEGEDWSAGPLAEETFTIEP